MTKNIDVRSGCMLEVLAQYPDNSFDSVVTDPPYGISFMAKRWDYDVPSVEMWKEVLRVLKPGGHALIACGTRTQHRMVCNVEDAGFQIRDVITHLYGSGFPKSLNISKAIDKEAGAEAAKQWDGFGTALKPAVEFWTLARKPLSEKTVAKNVLKHGTGGLNIDQCRVGLSENEPYDLTTIVRPNVSSQDNGIFSGGGVLVRQSGWQPASQGRFPANLILDEVAAAALDEQSGFLVGAGNKKPSPVGKGMFGMGERLQDGKKLDDGGGASRFFMVIPNECGHEKIAADATFAGKKTENKSDSLSTDGCGNKPTVLSHQSTIFTTLTETHSTTQSTILSVCPHSSTGKDTTENVSATEKAQTGLSVNASDVECTSLFPASVFEAVEPIKGIAQNAAPSTCATGVNGIVNTGTRITAPIESETSSRFFYVAKASKKDRGEGNTHPTVKPTKLMEYLCTLVTPPGGTVLDPFCGSGSTGVAAVRLGFNFVGIEKEESYVAIAQARIGA